MKVRRVAGMAGLMLMMAAGGCALTGGSLTSVRSPVGEDFMLAPRQTATVGDEPLWVTFGRVVEDSRCPTGVQCVRAGEARVELLLRTPGRQAEMAVLTTPVEPSAADYGPYRVRLLRLEPLPTESGPPARYLATLRVDRR